MQWDMFACLVDLHVIVVPIVECWVLPVGFRTTKQIGIAISGGHSITIMTNGQIYPTTPQGSSDYLDGVRFLADS
jgi:hypothetical protein